MAKVLKTLKKKAQATPVVGVILDSLKSENPRQNAPSIQAVLDNLQPKQLLINPDFQINQRGKAEYNESKNGTYTLDMWRTRQGNYINAIKMIPKSGGGVTIILPSDGINAGFNQCLPMDESNLGKKFVAVVSKDGKIYDYKVTLATTDVGKYLESGVKLNVTYDNVNKYIRFAFYFENASLESKTFDIDYCNLFEGDIVYPHVKKSYQDDLWECMSYIQRIRGVFISQYSTSYESQTFINLKREMIETPTIVEWGLDTFYYNSTGNIIINSRKLITESYNPKNVINAILTYEADEVIKRIRIDFIASCEPL